MKCDPGRAEILCVDKIGKILGRFFAGIFWPKFFGRDNWSGAAGPGPPIGPTMPWPGNFSDTLTPHLRTPTRI